VTIAPVTTATAHLLHLLLLLKYFLTVKWSNMKKKKHKWLFWWCILWVLDQIVIAHPPNTRLLRFLTFSLSSAQNISDSKENPSTSSKPSCESQISPHEPAVMRQRHRVFTTSRRVTSAGEMKRS